MSSDISGMVSTCFIPIMFELEFGCRGVNWKIFKYCMGSEVLHKDWYKMWYWGYNCDALQTHFVQGFNIKVPAAHVAVKWHVWSLVTCYNCISHSQKVTGVKTCYKITI